MENGIFYAHVADVAHELSTLTGQTWHAVEPNEDYSWQTIHLKESTQAISLHKYNKENRIYISGSYPRDDNQSYIRHGDILPKIKVSLDKTAKQVAQDIVRRLLPEYQILHQQVAARIAEHVKHTRGKDHTLGRLASVLGINRVQEKYRNSNLEHSLNVKHGLIQIDSKDSVTFKVHTVTADQAVELAQFLKLQGIA